MVICVSSEQSFSASGKVMGTRKALLPAVARQGIKNAKYVLSKEEVF